MELSRFPIAGVTYHSAETVQKYCESGAWIWMTVGDALRAAAKAVPSQPFVIDDDGTLTYEDVDRQSESIAASLLDAGLVPGDRAIFQVGAVKELIPALFGCFKASIIPVCSLPQYREVEIGQLVQLSNARGYFAQDDFSPTFDLTAFAKRMREEYSSLEALIVCRESNHASAHEHLLSEMATRYSLDEARKITRPADPGPGDVLAFQLSGGSTGVPKIIPRMHADYLGAAASWNVRQQLDKSDIALWALPLIHNAGMLCMLVPALIAKRPLVIQSRFNIDDFLTAIEEYQITYTGSIGPIGTRIIDHPDISRHDLSSLKSMFTLARAEGVERQTGARTLQMYGITEGLLMACAPDESAEARHGTMGWPTGVGDEIKLLEPEGLTPVQTGETGELCFRSPHMLLAYYNAPDATQESFTSDGFFRTGDLVRQKEIDGRTCYIFEGRLKDNINRGGEKFGAEELEGLIAKHPAVSDVRVVAMPDPFLGERACAFIVIKTGDSCPSVPELGAFLQGLGLAKFKLPERIETINEFPVTRVGKVDKRALREKIAEILIRERARSGATVV